jgi:hypothetical protein
MTPTDSYQTTDLNGAAFLVARDVPLLRVERQPSGGRCTFHFPADAADAAQTFYQGATVPARAFANALRDLKTLTRER